MDIAIAAPRVVPTVIDLRESKLAAALIDNVLPAAVPTSIIQSIESDCCSSNNYPRPNQP